MECIERIFYRKINPSDFKKLYDIDKPEGGGGQTYLEAAGISNEKIVDFLSYAEVTNSPLPDETRSVYTFNAYVLGDSKGKCSFVEFAPRKGRNNYRISRQNMKYKHPAWSLDNGFPEPSKGDDGEYTSAGDFVGIIDNLVILIIRTTNRRYYAGFVNTATMPENWPHNIGLEGIFSGERRDVLNMDAYKLQFVNDASNPFGDYVPTIEECNRATTGCNVLLYGVPGAGKSWTIEHEYCADEGCMERLVFHPDYMYSDFVGQILPVVRDDDKVRYEFTPGPFTKLLKKAYWNPEQSFYLIVEEINRGNAPAIFGEIFQLLDRKDEDEIDENGEILYKKGTSEYGITNANIARIVYGDENHKVRIPANMSILGTMNTSDQNVFTLDTAFQRRWIMRMIPNSFKNHRFADNKILDRAIGCCGMMTTFTFGKEGGNQAEMLRTATLAALNHTLSESVESGSKVSLYINCGYVRNVLIQKRYRQWQNNGWETEQGRPVAEADLWKKLLALLGIMDVQPIQKSVWEQDYEVAKKLLRVAEFNASSPEEKDLA